MNLSTFDVTLMFDNESEYFNQLEKVFQESVEAQTRNTDYTENIFYNQNRLVKGKDINSHS